MNWNTIEGKWDQLKGTIKSQFGKLTDEDLAQVSGKKDQLVGKIQERYGILKDEAESQIDRWLAAIDPSSKESHEDNIKNA